MTETWPVASHGPLTEIAPGLWTVDATLDLLPIGRRMTVWRAGDGRLAVHSAVCVDAPTLAALEVLGPIGWIVVPSGFHRLDAPRWKARFPAAAVVAQPAAHRRIAARVAVDGELDRLPPGGDVTWQAADGVPHEAVFIHRAPDGSETAICNDAFMNLPDRLPGVKGALVRLLGSTGGPKVTWTARVGIVDDRRAWADHLRRLAARPALARIIPGHGAIVTADAGAAFRRAADGLHRPRA
jgi:hypothetical protein